MPKNFSTSKNHKTFAKKHFGQNFLSNPQIIQKIIDVIEPANKNIIEIGPGRGAITKELAKLTNNFTAFEIDPDMKDYLLENEIINEQQIVLQDFLASDLSDYKNYEIVGNIPYYITSEILFKVFELRHQFKKAVFLVQKEVADRLVAKPNSGDYSKLSITAQYIADVKKEFIIKNTLFDPIPKVDSALVSFNFKQDKNDNYEQLKEFFKLCFLARRKKLIYSLKSKYAEAKILEAYKTLNLGENTRIQELDLPIIVNLFNLLNK